MSLLFSILVRVRPRPLGAFFQSRQSIARESLQFLSTCLLLHQKLLTLPVATTLSYTSLTFSVKSSNSCSGEGDVEDEEDESSNPYAFFFFVSSTIASRNLVISLTVGFPFPTDIIPSFFSPYLVRAIFDIPRLACEREFPPPIFAHPQLFRVRKIHRHRFALFLLRFLRSHHPFLPTHPTVVLNLSKPVNHSFGSNRPTSSTPPPPTYPLPTNLAVAISSFNRFTSFLFLSSPLLGSPRRFSHPLVVFFQKSKRFLSSPNIRSAFLSFLRGAFSSLSIFVHRRPSARGTSRVSAAQSLSSIPPRLWRQIAMPQMPSFDDDTDDMATAVSPPSPVVVGNAILLLLRSAREPAPMSFLFLKGGVSRLRV